MRISERHIRFRLAPLLLSVTALPLLACGNDAATSEPAAATSIAAVQGSGDASPLEGQSVTVSGIVTGDFQDNDADAASNLGGFYLQSLLSDADPTTSDAVFVFDGDAPATDVSAGDRVTVRGQVQEHFGETQIVAAAVSVDGTGSVSPADLDLPFSRTTTNSDGDFIADLEAMEGMLIRLPQGLTVTELHNTERFGDLLLSSDGRLMQFTNINAPSVDNYTAYREAIAKRSIVLDDGRRVQGVTPVRYLYNADGATIRVGDTVSDVVGVLRYSRASGGNGAQTWRIEPVEEPTFDSDNPRPGKPELAGELHIASYNVLNMFSGIDDGSSNCGPRGDDNCRGADSAAEYSRQLQKTTTALAMIDADIVGLVELENNADASLRVIVDSLNAEVGAGTYAYLDTGTIGDDAIKTGFIYKPATVEASGDFATLTAGIDPRFNDRKNRPPLAQTFTQHSNGESLTIVVNHLKSKGSDCDDLGDPNIRDGQGNCNQTRTAAAAAMAEWLSGDPTQSGDPDVLIIGDLNAHVLEDPLTALKEAGYENLLERNNAPYSFVFDGQSGALDHALVSASLVAQVVDVQEWHINADESRLHDYNLENGRDPAIFDGATPYRASDHDPVIIGLDLN